MIDPLIGVSSPVRLLREEWKTPKALAEELYAMFTAKGPREVEGPITVRVPEGQPAIRVVRRDAAPAAEPAPPRNSPRPSPTGPGNAFPSRPRVPTQEQSPRPRQAGQDPGERRRSDSDSAHREPDIPSFVAGADVRFDASAAFTQPVSFAQAVFQQPPLLYDPQTGRYRPMLPAEDEMRKLDPSLGGTGNASAPLFGVVIQGTGDSYKVAVCPNGFPAFGDSIDTSALRLISVKIPWIDPVETIPAGSRIFPIHRIGGVYYYQPPVWFGTQP